MTQGEPPAVLVVDDDADLVELYGRYLEADYDVRTATTGEEALATIDEATGVVVLDRRLPDLPGDVVLDRIRARGLDCRVAMVTGVDPDFDVVEMPFDDYLVKPVGKRRLLEAVEHLLTRMRYSDLLQEYYRVASTAAALEAAKSGDELGGSEEFSRLVARAEDLRERVTETLVELDDYVGAFHEAERTPAAEDS